MVAGHSSRRELADSPDLQLVQRRRLWMWTPSIMPGSMSRQLWWMMANLSTFTIFSCSLDLKASTPCLLE